MRRRSILAGIVLALAAVVTPAAAERLVISLSTHRVLIHSNFTGDDLVLFGAIEAPNPEILERRGYNVVVTVRGPRRNFTAWRKERILGIWVTTESREFVGVPSYLAVSMNRPPIEIGGVETLRQLRIGLANNLLAQRIGPDIAAAIAPQDPFRAGLVRVKTAEGLFREAPNGVTFLSASLFRTSVPIPGTAPTGTYDVETLLMANGALVVRETTAIEVVKEGFEAVLAQSARETPLRYGLGTALLAVLTGLFASLVFRRD